MSETTTTSDETPIQLPKGGNLITRELKSRKFRGYLTGAITILASQFVAVQHVWGLIVLLASYILGVAIEDAAAKSPGKDTNINLPGNGAPLAIRTKRVSRDPMGITTTEEITAKQA